MRKIGLDLGSKTCGIAISDDTNQIASGLLNYTYQKNNLLQIINELKKIINTYEHNVDTFVLGYPTHPITNEPVNSSLRSQKFKELLEQHFPEIKVVLFNENFSTKKAHQLMFDADLKAAKRKKIVDKVAATIILQEYLNIL